MKTFKNNDGRGFQITFPNGLMLSTQFGWGHYCENNNSGLTIHEEMNKHDWESNDAEIAILKDGKFIDVLGRVKIAQWLEAFDFCRSYPASQKEKLPCGEPQKEFGQFQHIQIFGLSVSDILFLKEFYINNTGDTTLKNLRERTTEKGFQG